MKSGSNIRTAVCFVAGLFVLLAVTSYLVRPIEGEVYDIISTREKIEQIEREDEDTIDVLFAGDSLVFRAISPRLIFDLTGITSYDLSDGAMRLSDQTVLIRNACTRQNPKLIVLEADVMTKAASPYKDDFALPTNLVEKVFPIFHYHNFYKAFPVFDDEEITGELKGYQPEDDISPYEGSLDYMTDDAEPISIPELNLGYLEEIVEFCGERDIKLLVMAIPSAWNYDKEKHRTIQEWSDAHGIEFVDLNLANDEIGIDWSVDTKDAGDHMNLAGSEKVSEYIAKYLENNYDLPDHRGDERYSEWSKPYEFD